MEQPVKRPTRHNRSSFIGTPANPDASTNLDAEMRKANELLRQLYERQERKQAA